MSAQQIKERHDAEKLVQRNPHPDFKKVERSRQPWDKSLEFNLKQTAQPDGGACLKIPHIEIDPYEPGRPAVFNYKVKFIFYFYFYFFGMKLSFKIRKHLTLK
jgi:flavin reductase (DIM6/NTAB) family NADH-FMN oxidoreductase RutF